MLSSLSKVALTLLLLGVTLNIIAQQRCGTPVDKLLQNKNGVSEGEEQFEEWIRQKQASRTSKYSTGRLETLTYQVQVIVHVIHNGEPLGEVTNISDAQILSQLEVLNKDFKRLN